MEMVSDQVRQPVGAVRPGDAASVHLNCLRGAAALLVFSNHTRALYFDSPIPRAPTATSASLVVPGAQTVATPAVEQFGTIRIASAAVVIFFVLSGYLVGGTVLRSIRKDRWSWTVYLTKRFSRLLVVLLPALLIGAALDRIGLHSFGPGSIYSDPAGLHLQVSGDLLPRSTVAVWLGNLAFLQGIVVPVFGTNLSLWSLSYEFWYYLIFPLGTLAILATSRSWIWRGLCLVAAILLLWLVGKPVAILFPLWLLGAAVNLFPRRLTGHAARVASWVTLLLLVGATGEVRHHNMRSTPAEYIIGVCTAVLLYTLIAQTETLGETRGWRVVYEHTSKFFSDISYSLYLFHLPLAVFLCAILDTPWHSWHRSATSSLGFLGSDLLILVLVTLLYWAFERNTDALRTGLMRRFGA